MKYELKKDYAKVFYHENWYTIKIEDIRLFLGLKNDEKITEDIIKKFMKKYYI